MGLKAKLKNLIYRLYVIGFQEYEKRKDIANNIQNECLIHPTATIGREAQILNSQKIKSKLSIGKFSVINGFLFNFKHGGEINIGEYCYVGLDTKIWSAKKIMIGNRVLIAHNVNIHDNNSHPLDSQERHKDFVHICTIGFQDEIDLNEKEIVIEDDVWIGFNATIFKGVKIGKGAIIGACTIVKEDVPPYAVVVGNPAKIIKYTQ